MAHVGWNIKIFISILGIAAGALLGSTILMIPIQGLILKAFPEKNMVTVTTILLGSCISGLIGLLGARELFIKKAHSEGKWPDYKTIQRATYVVASIWVTFTLILPATMAGPLLIRDCLKHGNCSTLIK